MKKNLIVDFVKRLVGFTFTSLLVTDIFIGFYYKILIFLNRNFPKHLEEKFLVSAENTLLKPEYDIQTLFLTLAFLIFFLWLYSKVKKIFFQNIIDKNRIIFQIGAISIIPLGLYYINKLGLYPLSQGQQIDNAYVFPYLITITILTIFFGGAFFLLKKNNYIKKILMIVLIFIIAILTFVPKFPIYYYDYSFLSGPILEISRGKTIYNQIGSQYAFILALLLGYLAKFSLFNIANLPVLVWLLYVVQYFLCFYLVLKLSDSIILSLLSLFSIITINYFSSILLGPILPQVGPVRWLPLILSILFLYLFKNIQSKKFILSLVILSFFTVDSGIYLIMAYFVTLAIIFIKKEISPLKALRNIFLFFIFLVGYYLVINLINLGLGYHFINILLALNKIKEYSQLGYGMIPIPNESFVWVIIGVYIASLVYYFKQTKIDLADNILIYSAHLSIFTSIYYFGRSHPNNLFNIALFFILNVSIFISVLIKRKSFSWLKPAILVIFYLVFIIIPAYARGYTISSNIKLQLSGLSSKDIFIPEIKQTLLKYSEETKLINEYIPENKIVIIHIEDTYLFYLTGKNNLMDMDPQAMIRTQEESNFGLDNVYKVCPKRIAVDCKLFNRCGSPQITEDDFLAQRLSLIENKCQVRYYPIVCTYQLCIAESK